MKLNKKKIKRSKLLKLNIIKTQLYKKINTDFLNLNDVILRFKQALQIIYKYHVNNKKILFVGFPNSVETKFQIFFKDTNHILIPNSFWMNGLITNPKKCLSYFFKNSKLSNKKLSKTLMLLNEKVDLIVLLNSNAEKNILDESYISKIPLIYLNNYLNIFDSRPSYKIPGNFKFYIKNPRNNFFYSIMYSLFKRAQKNKIKVSSSINKQYLITIINNQKPTKIKKQIYNKFKKKRNFNTLK